MDMKKDYEYFRTLWEDHRPSAMKHTPKLWDSRANDWAELLNGDTAFKRSLGERVFEAAEYLRMHGLLGKGSCAVDIGCGPGRFVAEFAKTADHVLGIDLSDKMLECGKAHAMELGLGNTSFYACDFKETDIEKMGWTDKFDLVFTSITPAIGDMKSLRKAMSMSKAYCFNSCFIHYVDDLEVQLTKDVFLTGQKVGAIWDGRWFYSLFNILWLEGYYPETHYHKQCSHDIVPLDDELIGYYTRIFSKDHDKNDVGVKTLVSDYLYAKERKDGMIEQYNEHWYGWILWDVRNKDTRLVEDGSE